MSSIRRIYVASLSSGHSWVSAQCFSPSSVCRWNGLRNMKTSRLNYARALQGPCFVRSGTLHCRSLTSMFDGYREKWLSTYSFNYLYFPIRQSKLTDKRLNAFLAYSRVLKCFFCLLSDMCREQSEYKKNRLKCENGQHCWE